MPFVSCAVMKRNMGWATLLIVIDTWALRRGSVMVMIMRTSVSIAAHLHPLKPLLEPHLRLCRLLLDITFQLMFAPGSLEAHDDVTPFLPSVRHSIEESSACGTQLGVGDASAKKARKVVGDLKFTDVVLMGCI